MSISVSLQSAPGWYADFGTFKLPVTFWEVTHFEKGVLAPVVSRNAMVWSMKSKSFLSATVTPGFVNLVYEPTARQDRHIDRDKVIAYLKNEGGNTHERDLQAELNRALLAIVGDDLADQFRFQLESRDTEV